MTRIWRIYRFYIEENTITGDLDEKLGQSWHEILVYEVISNLILLT